MMPPQSQREGRRARITNHSVRGGGGRIFALLLLVAILAPAAPRINEERASARRLLRRRESVTGKAGTLSATADERYKFSKKKATPASGTEPAGKEVTTPNAVPKKSILELAKEKAMVVKEVADGVGGSVRTGLKDLSADAKGEAITKNDVTAFDFEAFKGAYGRRATRKRRRRHDPRARTCVAFLARARRSLMRSPLAEVAMRRMLFLRCCPLSHPKTHIRRPYIYVHLRAPPSHTQTPSNPSTHPHPHVSSPPFIPGPDISYDRIRTQRTTLFPTVPTVPPPLRPSGPSAPPAPPPLRPSAPPPLRPSAPPPLRPSAPRPRTFRHEQLRGFGKGTGASARRRGEGKRTEEGCGNVCVCLHVGARARARACVCV
jgi:hypothetical protein